MGERLGGYAMNLLGILLPMWVFYSFFPIIDARPHLAGFSISSTVFASHTHPISLIVAKMEAQSPGFSFSSVLPFVSVLHVFFDFMKFLSWVSWGFKFCFVFCLKFEMEPTRMLWGGVGCENYCCYSWGIR